MQPLFRGTSHDPGRNAVVTLFPDRVERVKARSRTSVRRANQDVEITPVRAISSMQTSKDGWRTNVTVFASGNNITFRFEHKEAAAFLAALTPLTTGQPVAQPVVQPVASGQPAGWYPDPLGRHQLRWWGGVSWMDAVMDGGVQASDPV